MPKYSYQCGECDSRYEVWHGMSEEHDTCNVCGASSVVRIPALLGEVHIARPQRTGDIVNNTIEETKKEISKYKKELRKDYEK